MVPVVPTAVIAHVLPAGGELRTRALAGRSSATGAAVDIEPERSSRRRWRLGNMKSDVRAEVEDPATSWFAFGRDVDPGRDVEVVQPANDARSQGSSTHRSRQNKKKLLNGVADRAR